MRKYFYIIVLGIICLLTFVINMYSNKTYSLNLYDNKKEAKIILKLEKGVRDFSLGSNDDFFVAYKNKVVYIDKRGITSTIINNDKYNIYSLLYGQEGIYFSSNSSIYRYNFSNKTIEELVSKIPNCGDYPKINIIKYNNFLYFNVSAATNSGVVGTDNKWVEKSPYVCDFSPYEITLVGSNFGTASTGAFVPYNTKNRPGQVISPREIGNATIYKYDLKNKRLQNCAWGIRNVTGMDYNSKGEIYMATGGMENRGARPIYGDADYIYELKEGKWYGWPDFSGGDAVNSPRFMYDDKKIFPIMQNHVTETPIPPYYQHKNLSAITTLATDRDGIFGPQNSIYFYDNTDNILYKMEYAKAPIPLAETNNKVNISKIQFSGNKMYMLDDKSLGIYCIQTLK